MKQHHPFSRLFSPGEAMPGGRFLSFFMGPVALITLFPSIVVPPQLILSALPPKSVPTATFYVVPSCRDQAELSAALTHIPAKWLQGDTRHKPQEVGWSIHEHSGTHWNQSMRTLGIPNSPKCDGWILPRRAAIYIRGDAKCIPSAILWREIGRTVIFPVMTAEEKAQWRTIYGADHDRRNSESRNSEEGFTEALRLYETQPLALDKFPAQKAFLASLMQ